MKVPHMPLIVFCPHNPTKRRFPVTSHRIPTGLGKAGKALWRQITNEWELDPRELALLTAACRQTDDVALLEVALAKDGLITVGSMGQPRLNAVITELRQSRLAAAKLLVDLRLPSEDAAPMTAAQQRASKAARRRWELAGNG